MAGRVLHVRDVCGDDQPVVADERLPCCTNPLLAIGSQRYILRHVSVFDFLLPTLQPSAWARNMLSGQDIPRRNALMSVQALERLPSRHTCRASMAAIEGPFRLAMADNEHPRWC
jgi:hypothetical protein